MFKMNQKYSENVAEGDREETNEERLKGMEKWRSCIPLIWRNYAEFKIVDGEIRIVYDTSKFLKDHKIPTIKVSKDSLDLHMNKFCRYQKLIDVLRSKSV